MCGSTTTLSYTTVELTFAYTTEETTTGPSCSWNPWSDWSTCTVTCGVGTKYRDRTSANSYCGNEVSDSHQVEYCNTDACPTNGNWSPWNEWTTCDKTCNGGTSFRYRNCSNPAPKNGGAPCVGEVIQTTVCNPQECETKCEGGRIYTTCANRCPSSCADLQVGLVCVEEEGCVAGCHCPNGTLEQGGVCVPQEQCDCLDEYGDSYPPGSSFTEDCRNCSCVNGVVTCNEEACPVNCSWSSWSSWTGCSATCGDGTKTRFRSPNNPPAQHGGAECEGVASEEVTCDLDSCPTNCTVGGTTYDNGALVSQDLCNNCTCKDGTVVCTNNTCDGNWSQWSPWSSCNATCGDGITVRTRSCSMPAPSNGGQGCEGDALEMEGCNTDPCPKTECEGGRVYTTCANRCPSSCADLQVGLVCVEEEGCVAGCHCPNGTLEQGGVCVPQEQCDCLDEYGDSYPPGSSFTEDCRNCSCVNGAVTCSEEACPVDCSWSSWSSWTGCSATCGDGTKTRFRSPNNPPAQHGGAECEGVASEEVTCDLDSCPTNCTVAGTTYDNGALVSQDLCNNCTCKDGTVVCTNNTCDGNWSQWSPWSSCNATCGDGITVRTRSCSMPAPSNGGQGCEGDALEMEGCNTDPCPTDGEWCEWKPWSDCTELCAGGYHNRSRVCGCPEPQDGGEECQGPPAETTACNVHPCPVDCVLGEWTAWTNCSALCDGGTTRRHRNITVPAAYGGTPCNGSLLESRGCNMEPCGPVCEGDLVTSDCANRCPLTCADIQSGTECLLENCTAGCACPGNQVLQDGHCVAQSDCRCLLDASHIGALDDVSLPDGSNTSISLDGMVEYPPGALVTRECNNCTCQGGSFVCTEVDCAVDCGWSEWSDWSECPQTCGHVTNGIYRQRNPDNPSAAYGGAECEGQDIEFADCNSGSCLDCVLSEWTEWTNCSALCDGGTTRRHRNITVPAAYGGTPCNGSLLESRGCNMEPCGPVCEGELVASDCANRCPLTCADIQSGTDCLLENCTAGCACPGNQVLQDGHCVAQSDCRCLLDASHTGNLADVSLPDGSIISISLDGMVEYPSGALVTMECNNCGLRLERWSDWSECPQTCGHVTNGIYRQRTPDNPSAAYGGAECDGQDIEFADCNSGSCSCGENEVWSTQVSNCSMVSCSDLSNAAAFQLNSSCSSPPSQDEETCICEPGFYRNHDDECVLPSSCQCVDDEGVTRGAGEVWQRGQCETCLCENGAVVCKTECEPVECEEGFIAVMEDGACCPVCRAVSEPNQCRTKHQAQNFTLDGCIATDIPVTTCDGYCPSKCNTLLNQLFIDQTCNCCRGVLGDTVREIELVCPDGSTVIGYLPVIERCECQATDCAAVGR
eukprot:XP_011665909.1 PREDICTED: SCO-spondin [Strongylocentrotus purpuratus]